MLKIVPRLFVLLASSSWLLCCGQPAEFIDGGSAKKDVQLVLGDAGTSDRVSPDQPGSVDAAVPPDGPVADITWPDIVLPDTRSVVDAASGELTLLDFSVASSGRGPVLVAYQIANTAAATVSLEYDSGSGYQDATLYLAASDVPTPQPENNVIQGRLVWDSFADVDANSSVDLRLIYSDGLSTTPLGDPLSITLDNDPDFARLVLAPHPSGFLDGGGGSNVNNQMSLLQISSGGSGSDTNVDKQVGVGPNRPLIAEHGRLGFVLNGNEGTISVLDIDHGAVEVRAAPLDMSPDWISTMDLAADARSLFVLSSGNGQTALVEMNLDTGVPVELRRLQFASIAGCIDVSPSGDTIALTRNDPDADRFLELVDRRTFEVLSSFAYSGMLCDSIRFSPDGNLVVTADGMLGNLLTVFDVGNKSLPVVADSLSMNAPVDVVFHPSGTALLVSELGEDAVVPFAISAAGILTQGTEVSGGLPQAAEMDVIRRGDNRGLVAVTALSSVVLVRLGNDGSATKMETIDTGDGYEYGVTGMAIEP